MRVHRLAYLTHDARKLVRSGRGRSERQHHQGEFAVWRQKFAADDLIRLHALDERLIFGPLRKGGRKQRWRHLPVVWRLAGGKDRNQAARTVDQLEIDGKAAKFLQRVAFEKRVAFNDDEDVELVRGKALGYFFVGSVFFGIRTK